MIVSVTAVFRKASEIVAFGIEKLLSSLNLSGGQILFIVCR